MASTYIIDFDCEYVTFKAHQEIRELDQKYIGTENYLGLAYFWAYEYRHYLRDCTFAKRRKIHKRLIKEGLPVDGESDQHLEIIRDILKGVTLNSGFIVQ